LPTYNPVSLDSTIPTFDNNGIAYFTLTVTLQNTPPPGGVSVMLYSNPADLNLSNPYTFTSATQQISLSTTSAITQQTVVKITVNSDGVNMCRAVPIYPPPQTSPSGSNVPC